MPRNVSTPEFDAATASGRVVVDFYADWCGPCRAMAPALEQLDSRDDVTVVKVDIDAEPELARMFNVMSVPTLVLFLDGQPTARRSGAVSAAELDRWATSA